MNTKKLLLTAMLGFVLAACGGNKNTLPEIAPVDDAPPADTSGGLDDTSSRDGTMIPDDSGEFDDFIVYFAYDQSDLKAEYTDTLAKHARRLANQPGLRVRLEGHADERGSREYNIGLGERRAQAVRRVLLIQGASAGQISTVSFGEERPAALGSSEAAYQQNRRVAVVYQR